MSDYDEIERYRKNLYDILYKHHKERKNVRFLSALKELDLKKVGVDYELRRLADLTLQTDAIEKANDNLYTAIDFYQNGSDYFSRNSEKNPTLMKMLSASAPGIRESHLALERLKEELLNITYERGNFHEIEPLNIENQTDAYKLLEIAGKTKASQDLPLLMEDAIDLLPVYIESLKKPLDSPLLTKLTTKGYYQLTESLRLDDANTKAKILLEQIRTMFYDNDKVIGDVEKILDQEASTRDLIVNMLDYINGLPNRIKPTALGKYVHDVELALGIDELPINRNFEYATDKKEEEEFFGRIKDGAHSKLEQLNFNDLNWKTTPPLYDRIDYLKELKKLAPNEQRAALEAFNAQLTDKDAEKGIYYKSLAGITVICVGSKSEQNMQFIPLEPADVALDKLIELLENNALVFEKDWRDTDQNDFIVFLSSFRPQHNFNQMSFFRYVAHTQRINDSQGIETLPAPPRNEALIEVVRNLCASDLDEPTLIKQLNNYLNPSLLPLEKMGVEFPDINNLYITESGGQKFITPEPINETSSVLEMNKGLTSAQKLLDLLDKGAFYLNMLIEADVDVLSYLDHIPKNKNNKNSEQEFTKTQISKKYEEMGSPSKGHNYFLSGKVGGYKPDIARALINHSSNKGNTLNTPSEIYKFLDDIEFLNNKNIRDMNKMIKSAIGKYIAEFIYQKKHEKAANRAFSPLSYAQNTMRVRRVRETEMFTDSLLAKIIAVAYNTPLALKLNAYQYDQTPETEESHSQKVVEAYEFFNQINELTTATKEGKPTQELIANIEKFLNDQNKDMSVLSALKESFFNSKL